MSTTLKQRIILLCVGLVLLTAMTSLASFWWSTHQYNDKQVQQGIKVAQNVYQQYLKSKARLLNTASTVLTADFGFKQAVASRDKDTIQSALYNHSNRIDADLMLLMDLQGNMIAANKQTTLAAKQGQQLMAQLIKNKQDSTFIVIDNNLYQAVIIPVKAPRTIAMSVVGFEINKTTAIELKELTGVEMSFIAAATGLKASSIELPSSQHNLLSYLHGQTTLRWFSHYPVFINAEVSLPALSNNPISAVLSADLTEQYKEFDQLVLTIILLSCGSIILGFLTSGVLANNLTTPLQHLTVMAKRFSKGDYSASLTDKRPSREISELLDAFKEMGNNVQVREEKIRFQALHDHLTGFYNRTAALERLTVKLTAQTTCYFIAIDIRGLRHINDKLGPRVGDDCIRAVAKRIEEVTVGFDGLHARIGGDEFLVVMTATDDSDVETCVANLNAELVKSYAIGNLDIALRFSMGVVIYPNQALCPEDLVRRALIAVDTAAQDGQEIYYYKDGEEEEHLARLELIDELKQALLEDDGQLFMAYQPKLNLKTQQIDKVESLIRWHKPNGQWVSPEKFIDLAEQSGLIVELTQWVVSTVVKQLAQWQHHGIAMKAAINVSAQDIAHDAFLPHVERALEQHAVPASLITIELTERDMIENEEKGIRALKALKNLGVMISLDDYGVGQTSLGRLKMLPIDELKLDKVFILRLDETEQDQHIVHSTITLGHQLGFSVVAEGVENKDSLHLLKHMECDYAQGYYLSKPLQASEFTDWLHTYHGSTQAHVI